VGAYALTAALEFQLLCLSSFAAVLLSACVTATNSAMDAFCADECTEGMSALCCDAEARRVA